MSQRHLPTSKISHLPHLKKELKSDDSVQNSSFQHM